MNTYFQFELVHHDQILYGREPSADIPNNDDPSKNDFMFYIPHTGDKNPDESLLDKTAKLKIRQRIEDAFILKIKRFDDENILEFLNFHYHRFNGTKGLFVNNMMYYLPAFQKKVGAAKGHIIHHWIDNHEKLYAAYLKSLQEGTAELLKRLENQNDALIEILSPGALTYFKAIEKRLVEDGVIRLQSKYGLWNNTKAALASFVQKLVDKGYFKKSTKKGNIKRYQIRHVFEARYDVKFEDQFLVKKLPRGHRADYLWIESMR